MEVSTNSNIYQYVVFKLGKEEYGINIRKVSTIEQLMPAARVPKTPEYLKGVINLRGEIIPVIDLRKRFRLPPVNETEDTRIIIVKTEEICAGLIVDSVSEVLQLDENSIENVDDFSNKLSAEYINGVGKAGGRIVTLLNTDEVIKVE